jgi:hypothetical protein
VTLNLECDFNDDGQCNLTDIDLLTMEVAMLGTNLAFDLTGDGSVNIADRDAWRTIAGEENIRPGRSYRVGDASLARYRP